MSQRKSQKHSSDSKIKRDVPEGKSSRRDFLRSSTLLGVSAATAFALVGSVKDGKFVADAEAADAADGEFEVATRRSPGGRRRRRDRPSGRGTTNTGGGGDIRFLDAPDIDFA